MKSAHSIILDTIRALVKVASRGESFPKRDVFRIGNIDSIKKDTYPLAVKKIQALKKTWSVLSRCTVYLSVSGLLLSSSVSRGRELHDGSERLTSYNVCEETMEMEAGALEVKFRKKGTKKEEEETKKEEEGTLGKGKAQQRISQNQRKVDAVLTNPNQ